MAGTMQNLARIAGSAVLAAGLLLAPDAAHGAGRKAAKPVPTKTEKAMARQALEAPKLAPEDACLGEIVLDADGSVLHEKAADEPMLMASTSKMMADLLLADAFRAKTIKPETPLTFVPVVGRDICSLDDLNARDERVDGTVADAMMHFNVRSSNSAGFALQKMLEQNTKRPYRELAAAKAFQLGLKNSMFAEATGMSNSTTCSGQKTGAWATVKRLGEKLAELGGRFIPSAMAATGSEKAPFQNMTSPRQLAQLTRAAVAEPLLTPYLDAREITYRGVTLPKSNEFLATHDDVVGKSGGTRPAGGSLTYTIKSSGATVVLMHCQPTGKTYSARNERAKQLEGLIPQWQTVAKLKQPLATPAPITMIDLSVPIPKIEVPELRLVELPVPAAADDTDHAQKSVVPAAAASAPAAEM